MAKQPTKQELTDAAEALNKAEWKPMDALRRFIMPKETATPVPPMPAPGLPEDKKMAKGGKVPSASKRADGCATRGKTKGRMV